MCSRNDHTQNKMDGIQKEFPSKRFYTMETRLKLSKKWRKKEEGLIEYFYHWNI